MCDVGCTRFFRPWNADEAGEGVEPTSGGGDGSRGELEDAVRQKDIVVAGDQGRVSGLISTGSPSDSDISAGAVCVSVMGRNSKTAKCVSPPVWSGERILFGRIKPTSGLADVQFSSHVGDVCVQNGPGR